ncbi:hypothetical protein D3C80_1640450 [compost metagenome]
MARMAMSLLVMASFLNSVKMPPTSRPPAPVAWITAAILGRLAMAYSRSPVLVRISSMAEVASFGSMRMPLVLLTALISSFNALALSRLMSAAMAIREILRSSSA